MSLKGITLEEEFQKNKELKKDHLQNFRAWYDKQHHLPKVSDEVLVLFLHSCYYSQEMAKETIDNYFTCRTHVPEFFRNRNISTTDVKNGKKVLGHIVLPGTTPEGYRVHYSRALNTDPSAFNYAETCKSFIMASDLDLHTNGTAPGIIIIIDYNGSTLAHLAKINIMTVSKMLYYLQTCMPVRLKGLHCVNPVSFMDKILALMSPFMKKELSQLLRIHPTHEDLYKYVPKKNLPKEVGGDLPSFNELQETAEKELSKCQSWFDDEEKLRVTESKRPGKAKSAGDLFGMEGSFKSLDID